MEITPTQQLKMIKENSDAGLGERTLNSETRHKASRRVSAHALDILQEKSEDQNTLLAPRVRRMPGNGSFC